MELIDREKIEWYGCNFETPRCESENRKCSECSHAECSHTQVMQLPSTKVPDNPTNGDMIKAMFDCQEDENQWYDGSIWVTFRAKNNPSHNFDLEWWNAPYKGVEE